MSAPLIVLSGPPGSGKTTVGAQLAERFARSAHVLGDHFFRYICGDWKDPSTSEANEQNGIVTDISVRAAGGYSAAGYTTVLDGIYGPWFLEQVQAAAGDLELHYLVLRCDLDTALDRAIKRSETPAPEAVVRKMHGHFDQLGQYEAFVIDTTTATPEQVTDETLRRIESGESRLGPAG